MPAFDTSQIKRNTRYGLILFFIYLAFYAGFVALNAFAPAFVQETKIDGINLAVLYGLALIAAAFLLALVYAWLCRARTEGQAADSRSAATAPNQNDK